VINARPARPCAGGALVGAYRRRAQVARSYHQHFPGHGDTDVGHLGPGRDLAVRLNQIELVPFSAASKWRAGGHGGASSCRRSSRRGAPATFVSICAICSPT
jgi:hypothetical protein